jgi:hypothetical protein
MQHLIEIDRNFMKIAAPVLTREELLESLRIGA